MLPNTLMIFSHTLDMRRTAEVREIDRVIEISERKREIELKNDREMDIKEGVRDKYRGSERDR